MAKQSVLDIIIKTIKQGGGDKETVKGLTAVKSTIASTVTTFAALAGIAYTVDKVLDATSGVYIKYGQNVRDAKLALGLSAEETSRVIALTDDLGISYEDLSATIKKNTDNTNFSIEGLAHSSEEYLKLATAQDKAKFAQANYGKQWIEFAKLLEKGPDQVRAMAAAIDEGHLFDDEDLKNIENYRIAQDQLRDSGESLAMSIGSTLVPMQTKLIEGLDIYINLARHEEETYARAAVYHNAVEMAIAKEAQATEDATQITDEHADAMDGAAQSAEELSKQYSSQLSLIQRLADAEADKIKEIAFNNVLAEASIDGLTQAEKDMVQEVGISLGQFSQANVDTAETMEDLTQQVLDGKISVAEFNDEVARIERNVKIVFELTQTGSGVGAGLGNCFIAGTQISMADGSLKAIEDVQAGDVVICYDDEAEALITAKVVETFHHTGDEMSDAYLLVNGRIGVTPNHLIHINGQWAAAGSLQIGDRLTTQDGTDPVQAMQWIDKFVPTYNLHVDHECHNYFADGVLVHNAKAGGGLATGPGNGTSDSFLATLANGEFVVNANDVRQPGVLDLLKAINNGAMRGGVSASNSSRSITIANLTINARGSVMDVLEELG